MLDIKTQYLLNLINPMITPYKITVSDSNINLYNSTAKIKTLKTSLKDNEVLIYLEAFLIGLEFEKPIQKA